MLHSTGAGNLAFALMLLIVPISHRLERRERTRAAAAAASSRTTSPVSGT